MSLINRPKAIPHLLPNQLVQAEMARNIWRVHLESAMRPEDFMKSEAYAHVAKMLGRGDRLEVLAQDSSWYGEFLVRSVEGPNVQIGVLKFEKFGSTDLLAYEDYLVDWNPTARARVIRKSDNHIMVEGLPSKEAAEAWLRERSAPAVPDQAAA